MTISTELVWRKIPYLGIHDESNPVAGSSASLVAFHDSMHFSKITRKYLFFFQRSANILRTYHEDQHLKSISSICKGCFLYWDEVSGEKAVSSLHRFAGPSPRWKRREICHRERHIGGSNETRAKQLLSCDDPLQVKKCNHFFLTECEIIFVQLCAHCS